MTPVVIIGGGISGLATAYYLSRAGLSSVLVEREARLGGVIRTDIIDGCVVEAGPDSFLAAKPWATDLLGELGLASEVIGSNDERRVTYIWKGGQLVPLPDGLMMMVPTKIAPLVTTRLFGWGTKIKMAREYLRRPGAPQPDRSVTAFVADHYGTEAVDYLAEPLLAGVYGGDPAELSVASVLTRFVEIENRYGSLTRGVLAERRKSGGAGPLFRTLKGGLGFMIEALERAIGGQMRVHRAAAETVERSAGGYRVRLGGEWLEAAAVVLACPAHEAARLTTAADPELAQLLAAVPYRSAMTLALGYDQQALGHPLNGFGFLVPKRERRSVMACTWVGTKFAYRVPEGQALLRCSLDAPLDESDETVLGAVRDELRKIMGVSATPTFTRIARWPQSMAQYTVGHAKRVVAIEGRLQRVPGLHLAGNAYYGIGIPDCIRMGKQAAERIASKPVVA